MLSGRPSWQSTRHFGLVSPPLILESSFLKPLRFCIASDPLLFLLEEVPLLDQGVAHSSGMSICWVPKRANENLS